MKKHVGSTRGGGHGGKAMAGSHRVPGRNAGMEWGLGKEGGLSSLPEADMLAANDAVTAKNVMTPQFKPVTNGGLELI